VHAAQFFKLEGRSSKLGSRTFVDRDVWAALRPILSRRRWPMKKKTAKKIALHRETLRLLEETSLAEVEGGATNQRTVCGSCPASACHPTFCTC
jgi:hypothetical protein